MTLLVIRIEDHLAGAWIALFCAGLWKPACVCMALDLVLTLGRKGYERKNLEV